MNLKEKVDVYEGFPIEGISFKDINSLIGDGAAYQEAIDRLYDIVKPLDVNKIVSPESRGYMLACPLAYKMGIGMVPVRKPGKLPGEVLQTEYELEYGCNTLQIQKDAIKPGDRVILIDDLLATGGTINAAAELVESMGAEVAGMVFLIELTDLGGKDKLKGMFIESLIQYPH